MSVSNERKSAFKRSKKYEKKLGCFLDLVGLAVDSQLVYTLCVLSAFCSCCFNHLFMFMFMFVCVCCVFIWMLMGNLWTDLLWHFVGDDDGDFSSQ